MGVYLNPGNQRYQMAVNSEIFIDKSGMIQYLNSLINTQQRFLSVSRPRRFGKSMAADMICAYYDREADSRKVFQDKMISECPEIEKASGTIRWDNYLGKFDVIRLVMTKFLKNKVTISDALLNMQRLVIREYKKAYPEKEFLADDDLIQTLDDVYGDGKKQVVIVIDEWDAFFRERKEDKEGQKEYLDFLRDLMKDNDHIALAYITGILPIKKYGKHSALNMFTEYSMMFPRELAQYTGFTEAEVKNECFKYDMSFSEVSHWYDGYIVSDSIPPEKREEYREGTYNGHKIAIYSPLSVVEALSTGMIRNYWNKTETFEALADYINLDLDGLKKAITLLMDGGRVKIDTSTYQNDMTTFTGRDDVLSLLVHLGYLGFEDERSEVYIPNREVLDEFKASTKNIEWSYEFDAFKTSQELLKATWMEDNDKVAELIEKAHDKADNKTYNDEAALGYAILYGYYAAEKYYTVLPELDTGKGYADKVYIPRPEYSDKPVLIIELKYNKGADDAIDQIKRQKYSDRLTAYKGNILLVGINYDRDAKNTDTEFKHHSCKIERL